MNICAYLYMYVCAYINVYMYMNIKREMYRHTWPMPARSVQIYEKRHIYMERDLYILKESYIYEKRPTYVCIWIWRENIVDIPNLCLRVQYRCMKRDLYIWKETYIYIKRPTYMKRDRCLYTYEYEEENIQIYPTHASALSIDVWKETYIYGKKPKYIFEYEKRNIQIYTYEYAGRHIYKRTWPQACAFSTQFDGDCFPHA